MKIRYDNIGSYFYKEIKNRNLSIDSVSKATHIPYTSLHNFLHDHAANLFIEKLGKLADFLSIKEITIYFSTDVLAIKENKEEYNPNYIDLNNVTPETAKMILKLYHNDEHLKNRLGL